MDDGVQLTAFHPDSSQMAFPVPQAPPTPVPNTKPEQDLRNAVRGLFFMKPEQPGQPPTPR